MNREQVSTEYEVTERGTIASPGKFEGEMWYVVALWDLVLDGGSDHTGSDNVEWFKIDQAMIEAFALDAADLGRYFAIYERSDGFVCCGTRASVIEPPDDETDNGDDDSANVRGAVGGGYTDCACRDCFEIAISTDVNKPALCHDCADAGCSADGADECQAPDAYGTSDEGKV